MAIATAGAALREFVGKRNQNRKAVWFSQNYATPGWHKPVAGGLYVIGLFYANQFFIGDRATASS